jgi:hypothetical protein
MHIIHCIADHDVWMRQKLNFPVMSTGSTSQHIQMILTQAYTLKEGSFVVPPPTYLGADVHQHTLNNTVDLETLPWSMSSDTYIKRALADVETGP